MKIICIGRNYMEHAKEMKSEVPTEPVFFMKPDTSLLRDNEAFYYPEFSKEVHHEVEVVIKIAKAGKHIAEEFAHKYYEEVGLGIDFTARDLQWKCKEKGLPWEKAKAFDHSAPLGKMVNKSELKDLNSVTFSLEKNGNKVQEGNTKDMIFSFDKIISYVSHFVTLKTGDLIYTGTPEGVGPVAIGDILRGCIGSEEFFRFEVK